MIVIIPVIRAIPEDTGYSLVINENEQLQIYWEISSVNQTLISEIENMENYTSELFSYEEGDSIYWDISFIEDIENSWCTGSDYYWEVLVDEYDIPQYSGYYFNTQYINSHRYHIQKIAGDYAREMLIGNNYFTHRIIPQNTYNFLKDLDTSLRTGYFGFYDYYYGYEYSYDFESYEDFEAFLNNKSTNYQIGFDSIQVQLSNNTHLLNQNFTYNYKGILSEQEIIYDNQIVLKLDLTDSYIIPPLCTCPQNPLSEVLIILLICFGIFFTINMFISKGMKDDYSKLRKDEVK